MSMRQFIKSRASLVSVWITLVIMLLSITMPDFELDAEANAPTHPPMLAPERGAVRLAAVS